MKNIIIKILEDLLLISIAIPLYIFENKTGLLVIIIFILADNLLNFHE